jgi:hypothetical protein
VAIKALNLDLTPEQRAVLYEFTRAREVMATLQTSGWEHINELALMKIDQLQNSYLRQRNISAEALWAMHLAVQYVTDFWEAIVAQLNTTGDWLKDPAAVQAMIAGASTPEEADLEGELENADNPIPRFPEDRV